MIRDKRRIRKLTIKRKGRRLGDPHSEKGNKESKEGDQKGRGRQNKGR